MPSCSRAQRLVAKGAWLLGRGMYRTQLQPHSRLVAKGTWLSWLLEREEDRTSNELHRLLGKNLPSCWRVVEATLPFRVVPSVFGRNLQYQPVRGVDTREECNSSHAYVRLK